MMSKASTGISPANVEKMRQYLIGQYHLQPNRIPFEVFKKGQHAASIDAKAFTAFIASMGVNVVKAVIYCQKKRWIVEFKYVEEITLENGRTFNNEVQFFGVLDNVLTATKSTKATKLPGRKLTYFNAVIGPWLDKKYPSGIDDHTAALEQVKAKFPVYAHKVKKLRTDWKNYRGNHSANNG